MIEERNDKIIVSVREACHMLGIGRTTLYGLIKEKQLTTIYIGRRRLIPRTSLEAFVEGASSRA